MEHRARLVVLSGAPILRALRPLVPVLTALALLPAAPVRGAAFLNPAEALRLAFGEARLERRSFALTPAQEKAVESRARGRLGSHLASAWCAWHGDTLVGAAFFESRTIRTMPGTFMIVIAPDTTVARVDVLAFHEPPDYRPPARWLGLFARRRLDDRLWPDRDIRTISGATLSTRAVTEGVRISLALYELVLAPALAGEAP